MSEELVRVETEDGLFLDGSRRAGHPVADRNPVAFLLVHGTGSNFYHPGLLENLAEALSATGHPVWRINTRGHDGICSIPSRKGSVRGGATFEKIADAARDLRAWLRHVEGDSNRKAVLLGHSMGAVKSLLYASQNEDPTLLGVVALSPPRFCHALWMQHPQADAFQDAWARASALVQQGDPDAFLNVGQPTPFVATAAGFLEKYGPHDDYDYLPRLGAIRVPTLIAIGTQSAATSPAFEGAVEAIENLADRPPHVVVRSINGANLNYSGMEVAVVKLMTSWQQGQAAPTP